MLLRVFSYIPKIWEVNCMISGIGLKMLQEIYKWSSQCGEIDETGVVEG